MIKQENRKLQVIADDKSMELPPDNSQEVLSLDKRVSALEVANAEKERKLEMHNERLDILYTN